MIGTEDIRRALGIDEVDETQFFETKEELETLLGTLSSKLNDPDFLRQRDGIMDEISHIVSNLDVRFVPFLMLLLQSEISSVFEMVPETREEF